MNECERCARPMPEGQAACAVCGGAPRLRAMAPEPTAWGTPYAPAMTGHAQSVKGLGTAVVVLLGLCVVASLNGIGADLHRANVVSSFLDGTDVTSTQLDSADTRAGAAGALQLTALIATGITFLVWFRRTYLNATAFGASLPYSAGWAVGSWFVPFLNLVRPVRIFRSIWQASDPTVDHSVSGAWQLASLSRLITPWWIAWWTSNLVGRIASTQLRSDNPDTVLGGLRTLVAGDALEIVAAVLLIVLVRQLSARQTSRMATVPV